MNVAPETDRYTDRDHLKHPTDGVTLPLGRIDGLDHLLLGFGIRAADLAGFAAFANLGERQSIRLRLYRAEADDVADDVDADFGEQQLADTADGHAHRGFPRA